VADVTVFGAGAMGTAFAMHAARNGLDTALWANPFDVDAVEALRSDGRHPLLPNRVPADLEVFGPDELDRAASSCRLAVMAANSAGARSLARMVNGVLHAGTIVSLAKGLEAATGLRPSEVYAEELDARVIAIGGPCLAGDLAAGLPTATVWASASEADAIAAGRRFESPTYQIGYTDDVIGVELASMIKNVAAIGIGILDGLARPLGTEFKNAKGSLFTKAMHELAELVTQLGGRGETALGLAGLGDALATALGGRNAIYGAMVGAGVAPEEAMADMAARRLTVEGYASAREVDRLAAAKGIVLPFHLAVCRVLFEGAEPRTVLEALR
jgi:glycerol-3-phosphate dehydrogenase (NAD(P)+)